MASLNLDANETRKSTAVWRESCSKAIIPEEVSKMHKGAIFSQASMPKCVWSLAVQVMDLFKKAKLKGQKLEMSTLLCEPDFKQHYFMPIRTLDKDDQCRLLERVIRYEKYPLQN